MISYIVPSSHSEQIFQSYLDKMSDTLSRLGFDAVKSTHNDIMIGGYKVSGNACFALPQVTIVHGTMLYNVNFEVLQQAITPSKEKLAKHGVESVRQRVMNLRDILSANSIQTPSIEVNTKQETATLRATQYSLPFLVIEKFFICINYLL